jgi:hypothetical protein
MFYLMARGIIVSMYAARLSFDFHIKNQAHLQSILHSFVDPIPCTAALFDGRTTLAYPPQSLMDGSWFIKVEFREFFFDCVGGNLCLVVRDSGIKMVGDMGSSDFVVQEVNESPWIHLVVGAVNCVQSTLNEAVVVFRKMRHIDIRMLEPIIFKQKMIWSAKVVYDQSRTSVGIFRRMNQKMNQKEKKLTRCKEQARH